MRPAGSAACPRDAEPTSAPLEHAPYDPGPPVNVEAAPPPPPPSEPVYIPAPGSRAGRDAGARAAAGARHSGDPGGGRSAGEAQARLVAPLTEGLSL